jgi:nicotinamide riboside transporter PnuC
MKRHLHLPKIGSFWIPVVVFVIGVVLYLSRFTENFIEDNVPHLSAISFFLVAVAFILVWLGL